MTTNCSIIVLAAGLSTRMGVTNKLLNQIGEVSMIERVVDQISQAHAGTIIIVLGHESEQVRQALSGYSVRFVYNESYELGMTSSIQTGVSAASNHHGYFICLGDMPLLDSSDYSRILEHISDENTKEIIRPFHNSKPGHPIYFSKHFRDQILSHSNTDGCREIIRSNSQYLKKIIYDSDAVVRDLDTQQDFDDLM